MWGVFQDKAEGTACKLLVFYSLALGCTGWTDRADGARQLAQCQELQKYKGNKDTIVLGLPRGGVPMAKIVADELHLPMDIIVARKIGCPYQKEYALGALTEDGNIYLNEEALSGSGLTAHDARVLRTIEEEKKEARRRLTIYRGERPPLDLKGKIAILVDDGIATGATMKAAVIACKAKGASKMVVASPVSSRQSLAQLKEMDIEPAVLLAPRGFYAVGQFYRTFDQVEDDQVIEIMRATDPMHKTATAAAKFANPDETKRADATPESIDKSTHGQHARHRLGGPRKTDEEKRTGAQLKGQQPGHEASASAELPE